MKTVTDLLEEAKETFTKKNADYGNSFENFGEVMVALFPRGVHLSFKEDFNKFGVLIQIIHKLIRYTNLFLLDKDNINFESLQDTLKDLGIYAFMGAYLESK